MTTVLQDARRLADFVRCLPDFSVVHRQSTGYTHIGAILSDAVLQAGVNYKSVVWPRVQHILLTFPHGYTTSRFWGIVEQRGAGEVLQWRHPEKPSRLTRLLFVLLSQRIETAQELAEWLQTSDSRTALIAVKGIGPKTVDYLGGLAGIDVVAVDRHLFRFISMAGCSHLSYNSVRDVVSYTADLLGVSRRDFDYSIWLYQSRA